MSVLIPIKYLVDSALEDLTQENQRMLRNTIIVLRRLRQSWLKYFEDFQITLKAIEKREPRCYFFQRYMKYLSDHLETTPWESLNNYLLSKDFSDNKISALSVEYDEGAFFNRLSKNVNYLLISLFYLYQPRLTQKFFTTQLLHYLSPEEEDMLSHYQTLPKVYQKQVASYIEEIAKTIKSQKKTTS